MTLGLDATTTTTFIIIIIMGEDPPAVSLSTLGSKDPHGFVLCKQHEKFLRLTPTSKKDAPHSCLISLS